MTEKQENIITAALDLFAKEGFRNTPTSKIAKQAGVSEGLIFRHFTNKDGLLEAIVNEGEERFKMLYADIVLENDAKKIILKTIHMAKSITANKEDMSFWKLQYKLKWELDIYDAKKIEPLERSLSMAFEELKFRDPKMEAKLLLTLLDGLATRLFLDADFDLDEAIDYLAKKYNLIK